MTRIGVYLAQVVDCPKRVYMLFAKISVRKSEDFKKELLGLSSFLDPVVYDQNSAIVMMVSECFVPKIFPPLLTLLQANSGFLHMTEMELSSCEVKTRC
jgi:hypothetical protein